MTISLFVQAGLMTMVMVLTAGHGGAAERGSVPHPHRGLASGQVDNICGGL